MTTSKPHLPTASPIPRKDSSNADSTAAKSISTPHPPVPAPKLPVAPKLRLHIEDLSDPAAIKFLAIVPDIYSVITSSINYILRNLYKPASDGQFIPHIPHTRSVTIILRTMGGVAHTLGIDLDDDHKEIHCSLGYLEGCAPQDDGARRRHEICGVLCHELVHCYQHACTGTPGGLVEGVADFVRLKAGLAPPHWKSPKEDKGDKWDAGYQHTAYFLEWLENIHGDGTVGRINESLREGIYEEAIFWPKLFDQTVQELWQDYSDFLQIS